jgi:toxin-antitoxin system PIN domain toxin
MISPDTNLLFAWLNRAHPAHQPAADWFGSQSANLNLAVCELCLVELYGLLRNDVLLVRPLSAPAAVETIQRLRHHPQWELLDYPGGLMAEVWSHAAAPQFARRRIYDTRLALTLRHHGVTEFATANVKDFAGFGFTRVWNPLAAAP